MQQVFRTLDPKARRREISGMARNARLNSRPNRRLGDARHPLRRGGYVHRFYCQLDDTRRLAVLQDLGVEYIRSFGHSKKVPALRDLASCDVDYRDVDRFLLSTSSTDGLLLFGQFFARRLNGLWDDAVDLLGSRADRPSADDLREMVDTLLKRYSPESVGMFLAAAVEVNLPAKNQLREFNEFDHLVCPFLFDNLESGQAREVPEVEVDPEVRQNRRLRRQQSTLLRQRVGRQREQSRPATRALENKVRRNPVEVAEESSNSLEESPIVSLPVARLDHPRLGRGNINLSDEPVGRIGSAFIRWGPLPDQGKARPVVIVGTSTSHLWVRPIFTNDYKAGLWRAVVIDDWREAGLDHKSFVSPDVIRIRRARCIIGSRSLTLEDWNRVCRGEVHD